MMGLTEAKRYISDLHKRQDNPFLWPDYLTGLPDKAAILKKLHDVPVKLGPYSIILVRIANIHPYLIKYGPGHHAEIIQWAAAILLTTADKYGRNFVATFGTHEFIVYCKTENVKAYCREVSKLFNKKIQSFYSKSDVTKKTTIAFERNRGESIRIGLMHLLFVIVDKPFEIRIAHLLQGMSRSCDGLEEKDKEIITIDPEHLPRSQ